MTKPRGWRDNDVDTFKSFCKLQTDDNLDKARESLLLISKGNIPASFLVNTDGSLLPLADVCSRTMPELKRFKAPWKWQRANRTKLVQTLKESEKVVKQEDDSPSAKRQPPITTKRATIMAKDPMALAIHFFAWDGKPRNAKGIDQARKIEAYSFKKTGVTDRNQAIVLTAFSVVAAGGALGGAGVAGYMNREIIKEWIKRFETAGVGGDGEGSEDSYLQTLKGMVYDIPGVKKALRWFNHATKIGGLMFQKKKEDAVGADDKGGPKKERIVDPHEKFWNEMGGIDV